MNWNSQLCGREWVKWNNQLGGRQNLSLEKGFRFGLFHSHVFHFIISLFKFNIRGGRQQPLHRARNTPHLERVAICQLQQENNNPLTF